MADSVDTLATPICEAPAQAQMFTPSAEKPFSGKMEIYHYAWLTVHPERTKQWLKARLHDGFHIHHVDGDHGNDSPDNLILMDGADHMRLHGMKLVNGLKAWRSRRGKRLLPDPRKTSESQRIYEAKVIDQRTWPEFSETYLKGEKPLTAPWWYMGSKLSSRARTYAIARNLPWPPAPPVKREAVPLRSDSVSDVAAYLSRYRSC